MNDTLLLVLIPAVPAVIVIGIVILMDIIKRRPRRYYGTFYYKE